MTPMEELWEKTAVTGDDGQKYIIYKGPDDLLYLYACGFVDFRQYKPQEWIESFNDSKLKNGIYLVTKEQWLAKEKYRYTGPVGEPFDPDFLVEKEITEGQFEKIFRYFICPSTWVPIESIPPILEGYRKRKKLVDGKIKIDSELKKEFKRVLEKMPSPLRILQLDVEMIRSGKGRKASPTGKTQYETGPSVQKVASERLSQILKEHKSNLSPLPKEAGILLKDLTKKKPKGRV